MNVHQFINSGHEASKFNRAAKEGCSLLHKPQPHPTLANGTSVHLPLKFLTHPMPFNSQPSTTSLDVALSFLILIYLL